MRPGTVCIIFLRPIMSVMIRKRTKFFSLQDQLLFRETNSDLQLSADLLLVQRNNRFMLFPKVTTETWIPQLQFEHPIIRSETASGPTRKFKCCFRGLRDVGPSGNLFDRTSPAWPITRACSSRTNTATLLVGSGNRNFRISVIFFCFFFSEMSSFAHALAGATGGAAAMALTYPLDQTRTLAQAGDTSDASKVLSLITNNPKIFYKGCVSVIETITISNFIYFYLLEVSKRKFDSPFLSSTIAAIFNTIITEPLWKATMVIKTAKSTDHPPTLPAVLHRIAKNDGVLSLWSGTRVSLYLVSNPIIQFTIYEMLKRGKNISPLKAFIFGAISKSLATISTYPLQVAQTRLRLQSSNATILLILSDLYQREGVCGLYRGCHAKLFQTVLTAAFMFAFYERIVGMITRREKIRL